MKDLGFTVYDFFGYITAGILFIFAYQLWIFHHIIVPASFTVSSGLFYIIGAYIIGHLLSYCSKIIFERPLICFKHHPAYLLLHKAQHKSLISDYYEPLPEVFRDKINNNPPSIFTQQKYKGEDILTYLEAALGKDEKIKPRIDVYLSLYGFCRSISFTLFFITALIIIGSILHKWYLDLLWAGVAMACAGGMYLRYLKFYRLYAKELLMAYAVKKDPPPQQINPSVVIIF